MRSWAIKRRTLPALALAALCLAGCMADEVSVVRPHEYSYWEGATDDILRAESYQNFVNTLLLLMEEHAPEGTIRLYLTDVDYPTALQMVKTGCAEVQQETALGAYVLESLEFDMEELRNSYYEVSLRPAYRRTAEDVAAIAEAASTGGVYDLLVEAWEQGADRIAVRCAHVAEDRETLAANIALLQADLEGGGGTEEPGGESQTGGAEAGQDGAAGSGGAGSAVPWQVTFYPPEGEVSIIEVVLHQEEI